MDTALLIVLALILCAEFINGWTDAPNAIATVVGTRVLTPMKAILLAAVLNTIGAMSGTAVAVTIGKNIVDPSVIDLSVISGAMVGIVIWSVAAWFRGLPTSESHALVAGLAGAGLAVAGPSVLLWAGWQKVIIGLLFSTFLGFGGAFIFAKILRYFFASSSPLLCRKNFGRLQILSSSFMMFSHGSNDGQKFIGVFSLALLLGGVYTTFTVPFWVILLCAGVMGIGTSVGGYRIIRTMGMRMAPLDVYQGFAAETVAASAIEIASRLGVPVSTTHMINTSIMGVGVASRATSVRWPVVKEIVTAWILTFPVCGAISYIVTICLRAIL